MLSVFRAAALAVTIVLATMLGVQAAACFDAHAAPVACCESETPTNDADPGHDGCCVLHAPAAMLALAVAPGGRTPGAVPLVTAPASRPNDAPVADIEHPPQLS